MHLTQEAANSLPVLSEKKHTDLEFKITIPEKQGEHNMLEMENKKKLFKYRSIFWDFIVLSDYKV